MKRTLRLIAAAVLCLLWPAAALAEPPIWTVKDADSTIVLFGSVHVLPEVEWRPAALDAAMKEADDIWFEIPLDEASSAAATQSAMGKAMLGPGEHLLGLLDADSRERLQRICESLDLPLVILDRMQPWMVDIMISQAYVEKAGGRASQGVEMVLYRQAPPTAKVRAFETGEQQLAILSGLPMDVQVAGLKETLRQIEEEPEGFDDIVSQWINADIDGLVAEALEPLKRTAPAYYEALIIRRNADWVRQIKERLSGSGRTVMVVGVGHLVGPDSVPALLRKEGIEVEGP